MTAHRAVHFQLATLHSKRLSSQLLLCKATTTVLVKEQKAKEQKDKKEKQRQAQTLARRRRDEQVIAKYKASRACHRHTTNKAMEMFNQWKKEFHLAQLQAKVDAIMRSYATKGCEAEQDLLVEYLGKATALKHQSKKEGKHKPLVIR